MASNFDEKISLDTGNGCDASNEGNEKDRVRLSPEDLPQSIESQVEMATGGIEETMDERASSRTGMENVIEKLYASDIISGTSDPTSNDDQSKLVAGLCLGLGSVQAVPDKENRNENDSSTSNPSTSEEIANMNSPSLNVCPSHEVNDMGDRASNSEELGSSPMQIPEDNGNGVFHLSSPSSSDQSSNSSSSTGIDSAPDAYSSRFRTRKRPSNASTPDSEEVTIPDSVLGKEKPKHNWFIVSEVAKRELGVGARFHGSALFRQRFYSSLHAVQRLELMYKLEKHDGCVNTLNFNSGGSVLASGSDDLSIVLWNWAAGRPLVKYKSGHRSNVFQAKFLPLSGDSHIVSCSRDGQIRLAELSTAGVCLSTRKLAAHCGAVHKLAVLNDTPHTFLSCGEDALVMSIDVREERPKRLVFVKDDQRKIALYGIHSNPCNSNEFCVNGRSNYIRIYDVRMITPQGPLKKFCPQHLMFAKTVTQITCAMFNYNGTEIIGSYNDEDIYLFNTSLPDEENYKYKYEGHRNNMTVKGVNFFGPKSEYIVSGSDCGNIYFWEKATQAIVQWMPGDEGGVVNCLEPHPYIPVIATSGLDSDVKIWVPSNEQEPAMDGLREAVLENYKSRESDRQYHSDSGNPLMILWRRHMRRVDRLREQQHGPGDNEPEAEAPTANSSDEDSDSEPPYEQCSTS